MRKLPLFLASLVLASGCATVYQPAGFSGGYSEMRLTDDIFMVEFRGNGYTNRQTVEAYLLYRCAELTRGSGYTHFVIISDDSEVDRNTLVLPNSGSTYSRGGSAYPPQTVRITKYGATARIKLLNAVPEGVLAYEATQVLRNLGPRIRR